MIKIFGSALVGAALGAGIEAYVAPSPTQTATYRAEEAKPSVDVSEMMKRAKDLPSLEIENPI